MVQSNLCKHNLQEIWHYLDGEWEFWSWQSADPTHQGSWMSEMGHYTALDAQHGRPASRAHVRRCLCMRRSSCLLAGYLSFYLLYLSAGALVFSFLEQPQEDLVKQKLMRNLDQFLTDHTCVSKYELDRLLEEVVAANKRGVSAAQNVSGGPNWSFPASFFFSTTVITTIGYGHVTPLSEEGKLFCVCFAVFGIPLTLVMLSSFVERLMVPSTYLLHCLACRLEAAAAPALMVRLLHLTLVGAVVLGLCLLAPAAVFWYLEDGWTYLDSFYYCFISLTTIGLGDYIPGEDARQPLRSLYKLCAAAYLLMGLVMMVWFLTVFAEIPQLNLGVIFMHQSDESTHDPEKMHLAPEQHERTAYTAEAGGDQNIADEDTFAQRGATDASRPRTQS